MILQCMSAVSQCLKNLTTSQLKCKLRKTDGVGSLWCELEQLITIHTTSRPANLTATFSSSRFFFLSSLCFFPPNAAFLRAQLRLHPADEPPGSHSAASYPQVPIRFVQRKADKRGRSLLEAPVLEMLQLNDSISSDRLYF